MKQEIVINGIHERALKEQYLSLRCIAKRIIAILGGDSVPEIEIVPEGFTGYCIEKNLIQIRIPFVITEVEHIRKIAHECFHAYDFTANPSKRNYSDGDRLIIEKICGEYEYKYSFERDADIFAYAFANYYIREIVGYNLKDEIPSISQKAKEKYPELVKVEEKLVCEYYESRPRYYELFEKYKSEMANEFQSISKLLYN